MMEVYYLTVLEAGSPGSRFLAGLVSGEGLLHGLQTAACSLCPHRVAGVDGWEGCGGLEQGDRKEERGEREREKKKGRPLLLLMRTLILLDHGPTLMTSFNLNDLLRALSSNTVTLGV